MNIPTMPEHQRLAACRDKLDTLRSLRAWINDQGYSVCRIDRYGESYGHLALTDEWLYEFLGIDSQELEREREAVLHYVMSQQGIAL